MLGNMGIFERAPLRPTPEELERRIEIEREQLRKEIYSLRASADDLEKRFEEVARSRGVHGHSDFLYNKKTKN